VSIATWRDADDQVRPMLASTVEAPLTHPDFVYEPKYDGVRTLVRVAPGRPVPTVRLWSRAGNDKTAQFPAIVKALQRFALRLREPVLLDGEVVALDGRGEPVSFQHLQSRINRKHIGPADDAPSAFIAFDLLRDGPHDLRGLPLTARRAALERVFGDPGSPVLRLTPQVGQDGRDLYREAMARGWEGLIAKRASSRYFAGKRSTDWAKLKLQHAQEFVIGGWTEPRGARAHFGALLLGVYDDRGRFIYVGHVGTGFTEFELARLTKLLAPLARKGSAFDVPPPMTNETPHWVKPQLVAQVRFTEWTDEARLRHPAYLGLRDDVLRARHGRWGVGRLAQHTRPTAGARFVARARDVCRDAGHARRFAARHHFGRPPRGRDGSIGRGARECGRHRRVRHPVVARAVTNARDRVGHANLTVWRILGSLASMGGRGCGFNSRR
jgi:bifunctional non-homologous end joining protein LigD